MIRVIEKGQPAQARCTGYGNGGNGCGALLEYDRSDLRYYPGVPGDSWGSRDPAVMLQCPDCGSWTDLPQSKWPQNPTELETFRK